MAMIDPLISAAVDETLDGIIRPALGAHGGSVRRSDVDGHVRLEMAGSCRACFFRTACCAELVVPALREALAADVTVSGRLGKVEIAPPESREQS